MQLALLFSPDYLARAAGHVRPRLLRGDRSAELRANHPKPVLVSGAAGRLTLSAGGGGELLLSGGELQLQRVAVAGREVWSSSTGVRALKPGEWISWGRHE